MSITTFPQLSEHFTAHEFACRCGCGFGLKPGDIDQRLVDALEELREAYGGPIRINSGCRCVKHNASKDVRGVTGSYHTRGMAADVKAKDIGRLYRLAKVIPAFRNGGIGLYPTFIHVDVRGKQVWW